MSKHVFAVENLVYEYSILDIKRFLGELDNVKNIEVDFKTKTVTVNGGDGDEIERKLMMNTFHVEKLEIDEPIKKRTLFKKNEVKNDKPKIDNDKAINTEGTTNLDESSKDKNKEKPNTNNEDNAKPKKGGLFKKFLGKK